MSVVFQIALILLCLVAIVVFGLVMVDGFIQAAHRIRKIAKNGVCHICEEPADLICESCRRPHCWDHESCYYADVDFCEDCYSQLTPEEKAQDLADAQADEAELDAVEEQERSK